MKVRIDVPQSFAWVINQMVAWHDGKLTGEVILKFKDGGICEMRPCPYLRPNCEEIKIANN